MRDGVLAALGDESGLCVKSSVGSNKAVAVHQGLLGRVLAQGGGRQAIKASGTRAKWGAPSVPSLRQESCHHRRKQPPAQRVRDRSESEVYPLPYLTHRPHARTEWE